MNKIPEKIVFCGKQYVLMEERENNFYRALILPCNGGAPIWISNEQVGKLEAV